MNLTLEGLFWTLRTILMLSHTIFTFAKEGVVLVNLWVRARKRAADKLPYPSARYDVMHDPRTGPISVVRCCPL